ncbi:MAG TPA: tetratricopeptide repeat protein [Streptosporangiaceae bacterium]
MAKSKRQRKRDRAVRQAKTARKQSAAAREQLTLAVLAEAQRLLDRLYDPETPVGELAELVMDDSGAPVVPGLIDLLLSKGSTPERLAEVAGALREADDSVGDGPSLAYLTFAAGVARAQGDAAQARRLLDDALRQASDPADRLQVIAHLRRLGRVAEALELLEARLRDDPDDQEAAQLYAAGIQDAFARVSAAETPGECPCGSGHVWPDCCASAEHAALGRFADQASLAALRDALASYLSRSGSGAAYGRAVRDQVAEWLDLAEADDWDSSEQAVLASLANELALLTAGVLPDEPEADDSDNPLAAFAADPDAPPGLAAQARTWHDHVHYGLWQVEDPNPAPGWWCTDIVSGVIRYAAFPGEMTGQFPRWSVLLGGLVPVDGIWRSTGQAWQLSPAEADALAETVNAAAEALAGDLAGKPVKGADRRMRQPTPFGSAGPHGVLARLIDEALPEAAHFVSTVIGSMMPGLITEVHEQRAVPPALTNSDGDPMCLIKARIAVRGTGSLADRLVAHRDFDRDPDDPAHFVWLGRAIPANERETMLAELRADMRSQGISPGELADLEPPQRWIRGQLEVRDGELTAEVNSRERLTRLLGLLTKLGESPSVIDESRVDPAEDRAWPAGPHMFARGAAPPEEGWEKHWLDEPVPALRGRTPRQAAAGSEDEQILLEALLREFEYEADVLAAGGEQGIETAWLRRELDMDSDL